MAVSRAERHPAGVRAADAEVAARLRQVPIALVGQFVSASNATLLVRLCDTPHAAAAPDVVAQAAVADLDPAALAVYKPVAGEAPLRDFPGGTLHQREVAAYELSRALTWDLVPVTVVREHGPLGRGSLQRFVAHDPQQHYFWLLEHGDSGIEEQLRRMVVFDLLLDNADRKGGHVLLERGDRRRIQLIDHGVSFNAEPKLRTVGWHFAGEPVDDAVRRDVAALAPQLDRDLGATLAPLLSPAELAMLRRRVRRVADLERFPEPAGRSPFPWPLL